MKRIFALILPVCGALTMALGANAQEGSRDRNNPYYENNRNGTNQQSPVDRAMSNLNRAFDRGRLNNRDRRQFDDAARNLQEFQSRWARGNFDTGRLDRAINSLQRLSSADRDGSRDRDRALLAQDLAALRQFRASRGRSDDFRPRSDRDDRR